MGIEMLAFVMAVAAVLITGGGLFVALRREPPIPPGADNVPARPSGPYGWHISLAIKAWFALLTVSVLLLVGALALVVIDVADDEAAVNIVSHSPGDPVQWEELVRGTSKHVPDDHFIWVLVVPHGEDVYFPQAPPFVLSVDGNWSTEALIGELSEDDGAYELLAVLADDDANNVLISHAAEPELGVINALDNLPDGVTVYDRISVVRQ